MNECLPNILKQLSILHLFDVLVIVISTVITFSFSVKLNCCIATSFPMSKLFNIIIFISIYINTGLFSEWVGLGRSSHVGPEFRTPQTQLNYFTDFYKFLLKWLSGKCHVAHSSRPSDMIHLTINVVFKFAHGFRKTHWCEPRVWTWTLVPMLDGPRQTIKPPRHFCLQCTQYTAYF